MKIKIALLFLAAFVTICNAEGKKKSLSVRLKRINPETNLVQVVTEKISSDKVGIIVMDVWDRHWCKSWTERDAAMIPKMNNVLAAARKMGVHVIFSPSSVAGFYKDYPQRKAVLAMPGSQENVYPSVNSIIGMTDEQKVKYIDNKYFVGTIYEARGIPGRTYEGFPPLPPFAHTGGCECGPERPCEIKNVWTRQNKDLIIADNDFIVEGDNQDEIVNLCKSKGLTHLLYIGAAGNMCLTWTRETSIINMANRGFKPIIMEDLIISVSGLGYNPDTRELDPTFTPVKGDAIILEHLKKYVAPSAKTYEVFPKSK